MSLSEKFHTRLRGCGRDSAERTSRGRVRVEEPLGANLRIPGRVEGCAARGGRRAARTHGRHRDRPNRRRGRRARKINNSLPGQRICSIFVLKPPSQGNHRVVRFPRKDWPPPCATDQSGSGAPHDWRRGGVSVVKLGAHEGLARMREARNSQGEACQLGVRHSWIIPARRHPCPIRRRPGKRGKQICFLGNSQAG